MRSSGLGRASHRRLSKRSPGRLASGCARRAAAIAATTSARSLSAWKSTRKKFASWGRKAYCCARSSPPQAQKRRVLAFPVLYRSGAPPSTHLRTPRLPGLAREDGLFEQVLASPDADYVIIDLNAGDERLQ